MAVFWDSQILIFFFFSQTRTKIGWKIIVSLHASPLKKASAASLQGVSFKSNMNKHLKAKTWKKTRTANAQMTLIQAQNYKHHVNYVPNTHWSHKAYCASPFNVCSNHAPFNCSRQESKNNLQFMVLTYLWPWNKVKVIKSGVNC